MEFSPVVTVADLDQLDDDEIVAGYRYGSHGGPEPGNDKSRSFWHGWRNGMLDRSRATDWAQGQLIDDLVRAGRVRFAHGWNLN